LRPEGFTELAGDIVISCTGGPDLQIGAAIPTTNIVIYMAPAVPITSRFLSSNGASEALLIIDEAGANITTGATGGFGPQAPQVLCTNAQQQAPGGSSCDVIVGTDTSGLYEVAVPGPGTSATSAQNVYQGKVGDFGANSVTFYNVPVLPPATSGVSRTFRITNVRVPVPGGSLTGTLQAIVSTSPSQVLPVAGTAINIGVVGPAMSAAVSVGSPFQQCQPATVLSPRTSYSRKVSRRASRLAWCRAVSTTVLRVVLPTCCGRRKAPTPVRPSRISLAACMAASRPTPNQG
jgi:hypothetical protein